jgi:hypothetical protein
VADADGPVDGRTSATPTAAPNTAQGLGVHRWVVEQSFALLHWFRRLRIRWEIRDDIHEAFHFPAYATDLNPQEGIWSLVKRTIGNLAATNLDQLATAVKRSLKKPQYRPHLIDGCLAGTGLAMDS